MVGSTTQVLAGGLPLSAAVADEAVAWLTLLMSGEATDDDRSRWRGWRAAHADHERAWQHIESMGARLKGLHAKAAYDSLSPRAAVRPARRKVLRALGWAGAGGMAGALALRTPAGRSVLADHRTAVGERRELRLPDGTRVLLNTASAIDLRFDAQRRVVRLVAGEALFTTGHGAAAGRRPFIVETAQGTVRALGTRFLVRQDEGRSRVAVFEGAVELQPAGGGAPQVLQAGEAAQLAAGGVRARGRADEQAAAWTRGLLIADELRLDEFLAELGRYRSGVLRCDPAVASLRFSGVFPLQEPDRILALLPNSLPVQVRLRTRWWVVVESAGS